LSEYRPSDFKLIRGRQIGGMVDTRIAEQLVNLAKTRGTSLAIEYRRATREYVEREALKAKVAGLKYEVQGETA
jgi:hypothetical protein